jgi:hypothetical protein
MHTVIPEITKDVEFLNPAGADEPKLLLKGIAYRCLTVCVVEEMKKLKARVDAQEAQIAALLVRVGALESP